MDLITYALDLVHVTIVDLKSAIPLHNTNSIERNKGI